jgi:hypothetical protein
MTATAHRWVGDRSPRLAAASLLAVVAAPPIVAAGFTFAPPLQVAGATLLAAGLFLLAWVTIRHAVPQVGRAAGTLLTLSSLAVLAPMVLAVSWALGNTVGTPALSIPAMARLHGITNAVGFTLLGLIGWVRAAGPFLAKQGAH